MTNSKHTKRALLASILSVVVCAAMLAGSTFAWFTDSVTSGSNIIKSGNLKISATVHDLVVWGEDVLDTTELEDTPTVYFPSDEFLGKEVFGLGFSDNGDNLKDNADFMSG